MWRHAHSGMAPLLRALRTITWIVPCGRKRRRGKVSSGNDEHLDKEGSNFFGSEESASEKGAGCEEINGGKAFCESIEYSKEDDGREGACEEGYKPGEGPGRKEIHGGKGSCESIEHGQEGRCEGC